MKSGPRGKRTLAVEVGNVSPHGFWLCLDGRELFLPFSVFPWFENSSIKQLCDVQRPRADHLYWPQLDIDLAVESIEQPDKYPLVSRKTLTAVKPRGRAVKRKVVRRAVKG